jgi:predicted permease
VTASISLPSRQYSTPEQSGRFYEQLINRLGTLPGIESAGVGTDLPWTGYDENAGGFTVEGRDATFNEKTTGRYHSASIDYFRAIGIPLVKGRFFTNHDDTKSPKVVIVNETFARLYWPGEDAIGKRFTFYDHPKESDWSQIVGVVGDVKDRPDSTEAHPAFWWPVNQLPFNQLGMSVVLRAATDPEPLANQLRQTVKELDAGLAVSDVRLMNQIADESVSSHRFALFLVGLFAVLALVLATIGMYGVISYSVNQRMHEFGVRMALGARPRDLMRLVLGQGVKLAIAGSAIGLLGAVALARLLGNLLYGISGADPVTFASVALLALVTATFACYLPARRATQADPNRSLRAE